MNFEQILDAAVELLARKHRLTYSALKRQFELDDATLEDLKQELILGQRVATDEGGLVLVWTPPASTTAVAVSQPPRHQAERRQLTIMFCDIADSTALSNTLDVEDMRLVLRTFQDTAGQVIARHDGFVNSFLGDGIVVFFGYPQAHEDDAQRAVRAGLEVASAVAALRPLPGCRLRMRVGIATGVVVVGDVIGQGASREEAVVGNTSNLAARLQALALPGEVVIGHGTRKLLGAGFDLVDLGPQQLKGFSEPVPAWRVVGERSLEALYVDNGALQLPPMVDREIEFPAVMQCWRQACAGEGRMVTLRGEAGLGKSRLCEAVRESATAQDHTLLRAQCSSRFTNTALYPVTVLLQQAAHFAEGDDDTARLDKLEALLKARLPAADARGLMPCYAALLGLPTGGRYAPIVDSPERQREVTLNALEQHLLALGREKPVLLIFEDLHWADPTTLVLLERLARRIAEVPLMVLATGRPEFVPPWADLPHTLEVELSLLKPHHRERIVEHQVGGKGLPPEILQHILQKSDGIPLYVEELTKAMMESDLLQDSGDRFVLTGSLRGAAVPSTLHDSLLARLDRLSVVKEVAQAGAAIGREFPYKLIAALLQLSEAELNGSLNRLVEAELIHARGLPPDAVYTFKHALIQDAAYATMLRPRRQGLQARIAALLEADATTVQRAPELLAHHLIEADQIERAVPYLLAAGVKATAGGAYTEALKHLDEGLRLTATLRDDATRLRLELKLRVHMSMSLAATRGFAAPEVETSNQRARELCRSAGDTDGMFWVMRSLCSLYIVRSNAPAYQELAAHCVRLGQETGRNEYIVEGAVAEGYALSLLGHFGRARQALELASRVYRSTDAGAFPYPTPNNPLAASLVLQAVVSLVMGEVTRSRDELTDALDTVDAQARPFDQANTRCWAAMLENVAGRPEHAVAHAGIAIEISQRHGYAGWLGACTLQMGVAKSLMGAPDEAMALIGGTLPLWQASGSEAYVGFFLAGMARAQRSLGQHDAALANLDRALEHTARHGENWYDAELLCMRGDLLAAAADRVVEAEADFRRALALAREQGARAFELRAAAAWVRALGDTASAGDARAALAAVLAAIDELPGAGETDEARAARALLGARVA